MFPDGWELKRIGDIATVFTGGTPSRSAPEYWLNGDIPWARTTEVQNCVIREGDIKQRITQQGLAKSSARMAHAGTILIALIGQGKTRGQVALLTTDAAINQNCAAICLNKNHSPAFFFNYLLSQYQRIRGLSNSAGQSNLNGSTIQSLRVPVPPLVEQSKIASILVVSDRAIDKTHELVEKTIMQKKAVMQRLLTGKRRLPGFSGEWSSHKLGELFTERVETARHDLPLLSITAKKGVINRDDVGRKDSSNEDKSKYRRICPGDIGYNTMRMWQGVSALSSLEGIVSPAYTIVVPRDGIDAEFMSYLFQLPRTIHDFYRYSQGLTSDTWNLKFRHFKEVSVRVPGLQEQQAIAAFLNRCDKQTDFYGQLRDLLSEEKKALMQQLLTGKRRVKVDKAAA